MGITITGDKELIAKFQSLKKKDGKAAIRKAARKAGKEIASAIKANAPVLTGGLQRSVKVRSLPRSNKAVGVQVSESADFVGFLEFGTKHQEAEHKFKDAVDATQDAAMTTFLTTLQAEIEKAVK